MTNGGFWIRITEVGVTYLGSYQLVTTDSICSSLCAVLLTHCLPPISGHHTVVTDLVAYDIPDAFIDVVVRQYSRTIMVGRSTEIIE